LNRRDSDDFNEDKTGGVIAWVIIFVLLFVATPLGLLFLFLKLRGSLGGARKGNSNANRPPERYQNAVSVKYTEIDSQTSNTQSSNNHTSAPQAFGPQPEAFKVKKGKIRNPLKKKTGRFISVVLLIMSSAMMFLGLILGLANVLQHIFDQMPLVWFTIVMSSFFLISGIVIFFSRNVISRRYSRFKNYFAFIGERGVVPLAETAQVAGVSIKATKRDLQMMINNGHLPDGAYIDSELECLVLCPIEAQKLRVDLKAMSDTNVASPSPHFDEARQDSYTAALNEFREVNFLIADAEISSKVSHLVEVTSKIFKIIDESPEKANQLKRFMGYYLPTTIKLVRSYATLEKQGIKGQNIADAKENICNILDSLKAGFEQQLDMLFTADALDIAADINVLENLMQQDGLMSSGSGFQVMRK